MGEPVLIAVSSEDLSGLDVHALAKRVADLLGPAVPPPPAAAEPASNGEDEDEDEDEGETESELSLHESHLGQFIAFLRSSEAIEAARQEDENKLREMLLNLLRPATIVDGQHRVSGAAFREERIPFPVVALVEADWREQVFQFVVINQKAEPIKPEFLSAIISSSLSSADIEKLKKRLEQAKVKLDETRIMDLLESDPSSPFAGMIDFKIPGAGSAKLKYTGMLNLARRFRKLKSHERDTKFRPFFRTVFESSCPGTTFAERRKEWLDEKWFRFFAAFWERVAYRITEEPDYPELWEPGTSNLTKIVTLQELQNLFMQWLFSTGAAAELGPDFHGKVDLFLKHLKPKFFEKEWQLTSLQSDSGRKYLRKALENARKDPKYKHGDELFVGVH